MRPSAPPSLAVLTLTLGCASAPQSAAIEHIGLVTHVLWHGDTLLSTSQSGVCIQTASGELVWRIPPMRTFAAAAISVRQTLAVGGKPGRAGEIALLRHDRVLDYRKLATDVLSTATVSADGALLAVGGMDGRVHLLDLPSLADRGVLSDHTAACRALAFTADGKHLLSAGLDSVVVVRQLGGDSVLRLTDHTAGVECLALAPNQRQLASGARDGKVRVHDLDGRLRYTFARLGAAVSALVWLDDHRIVAGLEDGRILTLDLRDDSRGMVLHVTGPVSALALRGDGALAIGMLGGVRVLPRPQ